MKKLVIDLGNSETRITVIAGKSEYTGAPLQETVRVDNRYGLIQPAKVSAYLNEGVYSSKDSHIFEINNEYYCTGNICNKWRTFRTGYQLRTDDFSFCIGWRIIEHDINKKRDCYAVSFSHNKP